MSSFGPSVGEPGYLPYCGPCPGLVRMVRKEQCFECPSCGLRTRIINGEDMFDRTAPALAAAARQGGDAEQAPGEAPQSGGESRNAQKGKP